MVLSLGILRLEASLSPIGLCPEVGLCPSKSFKVIDLFVEFTFPDKKYVPGTIFTGTYPVINRIDKGSYADEIEN